MTSRMKEIGKQTLDPLTLNSFIPGTLCSSHPLPGQTSATHPAPTVWNSFPVCGKRNSDASSACHFWIQISCQPKKCRPTPWNLQGAHHSWITSPLISVSFSVRTTNKLYVDCKLRPRHPFFSDPVASLQDLSGCGCSHVNESTRHGHGTQPHPCE